MPHASADLTACLVALSFLAMGCTALFSPSTIGRYFGMSFDSVDSRNEVRAVYGGFGVAMALALVLSLRSEALRPGVVACIAFALAGMACGRVVSAIFERPGRWPWVFFAIEFASALALALTHFR